MHPRSCSLSAQTGRKRPQATPSEATRDAQGDKRGAASHLRLKDIHHMGVAEPALLSLLLPSPTLIAASTKNRHSQGRSS